MDAGAAARAVVAWPGPCRLASLLAAAVPLGSRRLASSAGAEPDQPVPVRGGSGRRHRAAGALVPRSHAGDGPVHRAARPQDVSALVAAEPGFQPGREPLPCRRPGRLVRAISGPCRLPRRRPHEFVRAYVADRHGFEARYEALSDAERAALALRQGRRTSSPRRPARSDGSARTTAARPRPARAAARRGALRGLSGQVRTARPAPAVAQSLGDELPGRSGPWTCTGVPRCCRRRPAESPAARRPARASRGPAGRRARRSDAGQRRSAGRSARRQGPCRSPPASRPALDSGRRRRCRARRDQASPGSRYKLKTAEKWWSKHEPVKSRQRPGPRSSGELVR